jgi:hypothetical protein
MIKAVIVGVCALALTASVASAQTTAPAPKAGMSSHSNPMDANDKMMMKKKKKGMMKSGMKDGMDNGMKKDGMGMSK